MRKIGLFLASIFICGLSFAQESGSSEQRYEALDAYARALGIVRYYSPNPYALEWTEDDWHYITYADVKALEGGASLEKVLRNLLEVMAPEATISDVPMPSIRTVDGGAAEYSYLLHRGCGKINVPKIAKLFNKELRDYRPFSIELVSCAEVPLTAEEPTALNPPLRTAVLPVEPSELPRPDSVYSYRLSSGLYLNIPHAERADAFSKKASAKLLKDAESQWKSAAESHGKSVRERSVGLLSEKAFKVSNAIIRWNIIQHFYPYHEEDGLQWDEYLHNMIEAVDTLPEGGVDRYVVYDYYKAVRKSVKPVKDSHLITYHSFGTNATVGFYLPLFYAPTEFEYREEKILHNSKEVLSINGTDALQVWEDAVTRVASSSEVAARNEALGLLTETVDMNAPFVLELRDLASGEVSADTVYATLDSPVFPEPKDRRFARKVEDVLVINPTLSMECYEQFVPYLDSMDKYRAVVFDLRGYPSYDFDKVLMHITDTIISTEFFYTPHSCFPSRAHLYYEYTPESLQPAAQHIGIPVYFLADYKTMSWGETVLMLVKDFHLGTIIGTNTQGTNGDATEIDSSAWMYRMTAIKTVWRDGSCHHGIGVTPDISIEKPFTVEDIMDIL